jgi:hypothetical protein
MALPTSGALSLNQMHVEAGGGSGTIASINDADIRGLISKGSGATMSFNEWYGASSSLDSQQIYIGSFAPYAYYTGIWYGAGRNGIGASTWQYGSMNDGTCNWSNGNLYQLVYAGTPPAASGSSGRPKVIIGVHAHGNSNSGWNTVTANGQTLSRTSMSFVNTGGGYSRWLYNYPTYSSAMMFDSSDVGSVFTMVFN